MPIPLPAGAMRKAHRVCCCRCARRLLSDLSHRYVFASTRSKKCKWCNLQKADCVPLPKFVRSEYLALGDALEEWRGDAAWQQEEEEEEDEAVADGNRRLAEEEAVRRVRILTNVLLVANAEAPKGGDVAFAAMAETRDLAELVASQHAENLALVSGRDGLASRVLNMNGRLTALEATSARMVGLLETIAGAVERSAAAAERGVVGPMAAGVVAGGRAPAGGARGGGPWASDGEDDGGDDE
ncbi:hypothetical protein QTJ16_001510 [Diplocarpon rosae]|uniref:Uncharacterized protein n=1 Tax=Diplocarpon rosae TaxID=946125 RepID=A0AAD9T3H7_9HELO|nr:hypothetical protein QTJ16_001510 [Diplocarpon rosae]